MIRMYSKRLMLPYVGVIQVAEIGRAQALSLDGENWAIRYALTENEQIRNMQPSDDPRVKYTPVATLKQDGLKTHAVHPALDPDDVRSAINQICEAVHDAQIPFAAQDWYEYWLLDPSDGNPLALLQSSVDTQYLANVEPPSLWIAMPAAQLEIKAPEPEQSYYIPPVNYRLQKLVEERAGTKPRGAWFERTDSAADDFPPCFIREDWEDEHAQQLCDLYIHRLAPRLLMSHGLSTSVRHRLEQAARDFVFDVEFFYPLYPEVVDEELLTAARVEARMRRAAKA